MKPDWDDLGEKHENSKKVLIGDVDCTAAGKPLCERFGVEGYPTLKYFVPPDTDGEVYEGGRDAKSLKKFIKTGLKPGCSISSWKTCSEKQKAELQPYIDMPAESLAAEMASIKADIDEMQTSHDALMKGLQEKFEESDKKLKALKETSQPKLKLMKAATKQPVAAEPTKDEM